MSETYPTKELAKHFSRDILPSSVGIDCKITNYFSFLQIYIQKNPPPMSENINGGYHIYLGIKLPSTRFQGSSAPRFARRYNPWQPLLQHRFDTNRRRVPSLHLSR